ncbi:hypothetical protein [Sphingomonas sp. SORGH_AS_0879]|uniref:hypothetical protein n=1 Tax=Sphingomonas sp. SORGH_AS_0879 TaxID=3041790 RepID=UPI002781E374|nr:hypothetical protein [Sphingomonas sp. SORGH_AS_0879]MDQ1231011.1 hypothetical protein [Sphingomonas sp. SORGH_AS_0879]
MIKQNRRYAPFLDTAQKISAVLIAMGAFMSVPVVILFNGFLGYLDQSAIPVLQNGMWVYLLLFSIASAFAFALIVFMPSTMTMAVRLNAPGLPHPNVKRACITTVLVVIVILVGLLWYRESWLAIAMISAIVLGALGGAWAAIGFVPSQKRFWAFIVGFGAMALLVMVWTASLFVLLAPLAQSIAGNCPNLAAVALMLLLVAMLVVSIWQPVMGILLGLLLTVGWTAQQASPDGGIMIASALYTANLGGGRPASVLQPSDAGEICNLGVAERPVLFFEVKGCSRPAAFARLRSLAGKTSMERRRIIREWTALVEQHRPKVPSH